MKKGKNDVPALYEPDRIYGKCNRRPLLVLIVTIVPMMPGLADKVSPRIVHIPAEFQHLFAINWLYGFIPTVVLYVVLNLLFRDRNTLIRRVVRGTTFVPCEIDSESLPSSRDGDPQKINPTLTSLTSMKGSDDANVVHLPCTLKP